MTIPASAAVVFLDEEHPIVLDPMHEPVVETELEYSDDDPNLVFVFQKSEKGRDALKRLSDHICAEYKAAWDASAEYRARWAKDWKLLAGELPPKGKGFEFCANVNLPISLENVSRIATRLYAELFDDFKSPVQFVSLGNSDQTADYLSKHTNWQFRVQIPDFKRQMHRACMMFVHIGDWVSHSYYDPWRKENRHEVLTPDEFVMPWSRLTTMPDLSDLPWYAKVCQLHKHELEARKQEWANVDFVLQQYAPTADDQPDQGTAEEIQSLQGQEKAEPTKYNPFKVIWWEGWCELPSRKEQHFVQAHVHLESGTIMKLMIHEEADWQELQEYELQMAEAQQYQAAMQEWESQRTQVEMTFDRADDYVDALVDGDMAGPQAGMMGMSMVEEQRGPMMQQLEAQRPQAPSWMEEGREPQRPRRVPVYSFVHAVCIEPLVGNRGLSYGRIQGDLQRAANALFNQYADAGTFGNIQTFIATKQLEFKGDMELKPGKVNFVEGMSIDDIRKQMMPLTTGQANPQMMEMLGIVVENAQKSMQAADILSGEPGKSGETYKGVAARIEQATKQLSVLGRKMGDAIALIARNNARLNSIFLRDEELVRIADIQGEQPFKIGRQMYRENYAVEITSDMRFATNVQRVAEADELMNMLLPMAMQGPLAGNLAIMHQVIAGALKARRRDDLVRMLGAPPPAPTQFGPPPPPQPPPGAGGAPPGDPSQGAPPQ